jgi:hypothetical protein
MHSGEGDRAQAVVIPGQQNHILICMACVNGGGGVHLTSPVTGIGFTQIHPRFGTLQEITVTENFIILS